ncbi:indolepyruvate oxidoreductase subunit beta [Methanobacterium paludis]|uniref:Indolepyruvate ferredoxin oxidoreductase subunit beta n=1 Tax=Methanobacterium paludis (strain DSM 25820 / JCM 18151 / SWAN1) TaxID=868131 RepID=F6D2A1_METPW|nr:indolepyruvate oxidoreductase subunit beta [Methanobacterium paludis]AEG18618.1 indolepyruvate ferredoxin oxidoreductase, beta subunit [Methanobacterium paludis]
MKSYDIYISGVGGQGIIKTSIVIGESAMRSNLNVLMSEIHGMSQRGGVVSTELKIGDAHSPIIEEGTADLLLAFEPLEALRAISKISEETYVVMNTSPTYPFNIRESKDPYPDVSVIIDELESKSKKVLAFDAEKIAKDAGHILSLNMVMIGGATAVSGFPLDKNVVLESMKDNLPEKSLEINMKAFNEGLRACSSK